MGEKMINGSTEIKMNWTDNDKIDERLQERSAPAGEPSEIRKSWGYVQLDIP